MTSPWFRFHNRRLIDLHRLAAERSREGQPRPVQREEDIYLAGDDLRRWQAGDEALVQEVMEAAGELIRAGAHEVCIRRAGKISPLRVITKGDAP